MHRGQGELLPRQAQGSDPPCLEETLIRCTAAGWRCEMEKRSSRRVSEAREWGEQLTGRQGRVHGVEEHPHAPRSSYHEAVHGMPISVSQCGSSMTMVAAPI